MPITLTALEIQGIQGIIDSDYRDGEHPVGRAIWDWSGNNFDNARTYAGVISSLVKKGCVHSDGGGKDSCITLLQAGLEAYEAAIGKAWDQNTKR